MSEQRTISDEKLQIYGSVKTIKDKLIALCEQQKASWKLAKDNYDALSSIEINRHYFGGFKIETHFNPERIRSTAAKTDKKSIDARKCFLCQENLPKEQKGILLHNEYLILCNPYPIFNLHFTISKLSHAPQLIKNNFIDMLAISKALSGFTVFYNGPVCGASAPDHFHFQACSKAVMPIEKEYEKLKNNFSNMLVVNDKIKIFSVKNYLRKMIVLESCSINSIKEYFDYVYRLLKIHPDEEEPRMNIICSFEDDCWKVILFPRGKQKPSHYFHEGEKQLIIGPASVEMGGIFILPRKEDFEKITLKDIEEIFQEVSLSDEEFENLELYI